MAEADLQSGGEFDTGPIGIGLMAELHPQWGWLLALGILWIVFGIVALVTPFAASVAFTLVIGVVLAVGGVVQIIHTFRNRGWRGQALHALVGILSLIAGIILLLFPLNGVFTLTLVLGTFFVVAGAVRVAFALQHREAGGWGWILFSGILGIVVGVLIWLQWPSSALWALGTLVGIELIFAGWAMVSLALAAKRI